MDNQLGDLTRLGDGVLRDSIPRPRHKELAGLSPVELKHELIKLADDSHRTSDSALLNAGRGNPNWVATEPREAFFLLGTFGIAESRRAWGEWEGLGGRPARDGIAERFAAFLAANRDAPGATLLRDSVRYATSDLGIDPDSFVHQLTDGVIGDNYPAPDRMLDHVERIVHAYLVQEMCTGEHPAKPYDLFATEGGTAAMCYLFDSLLANRILHRGDTVALMVPIFSPYLEIPKLDRFAFDVTEIAADMVNQDGFHTWQYDDSELEKLADPRIKALCLVNPSNPPSVMISHDSLAKLANIVQEKNPRLTIISDDVYGTFVNGFRSLMSVLPRNTLGVYSFSKYFGCAGWRLGVICVNQDNIFDEIIAELPEEDSQALAARYASITTDAQRLKFVDRLVADSRDVALNHTAGLSLPQQVQMALFALSALLDKEGTYKNFCQSVIARRLHALAKGMQVPVPQDPNAAHYYVELDLLSWAKRQWGKAFADFMAANYEPVDILFRLAENHSIVLLNGGSDGPEWSVRISLANLPMNAYEQIGRWLAEAAQDYKAEFDAAQQNTVQHAAVPPGTV